MDFSEDLVIISSSDPELGEAKDELTIDYQSTPIQIGFNARYLIEALSEISSDRAKITMSETDKAVYITDGEEKGLYKYESIVMPLRL
jgi:DNA polymerase-3 subunit beta